MWKGGAGSTSVSWRVGRGVQCLVPIQGPTVPFTEITFWSVNCARIHTIQTSHVAVFTGQKMTFILSCGHYQWLPRRELCPIERSLSSPPHIPCIWD